jgi:hypothetical protein
VADSYALEGTMLNDPITSTDIDSVYKVTVPLMGDKVACPVCSEKEAYFFFVPLGDLDKHLNLHHVGTPIQWKCVY